MIYWQVSKTAGAASVKSRATKFDFSRNGVNQALFETEMRSVTCWKWKLQVFKHERIESYFELWKVMMKVI